MILGRPNTYSSPTVVLHCMIFFFSNTAPIYSLKKYTKILIEKKDHRPLLFGQHCGVVVAPESFSTGRPYRYLLDRFSIPVPFVPKMFGTCATLFYQQVPTLNSRTDVRYWYRHQVPVSTFGSLLVQGSIKSQRRTAVK